MNHTRQILEERRVRCSDQATREVRLAASFSGGVSLAVWMGGVATELQAFVRADTSTSRVYEALLELTGSEPVIDILAGTSAGGINGSALALALANGGDVRRLRDIWLEAGDLQQLLRCPFESDPPSVLRGDDHLGKNLVAGLADVLGKRVVDPPPWVDRLRLTVTTTVLSPTVRRYSDALDRDVHTNVHLGLMRFRHGDLVPIGELAASTVVGRLAIASRASASYPGGFEAASVPVGESIDRKFYGEAELEGIADFPTSTWALDGGLLLNDPLDPLIADVMDQPAHRDVRRFVLQITPDPGEAPTLDPLGDEPDLLLVLKTALLLPRDRHIADELDRVASHNLAVRQYDLRGGMTLGRALAGEISDAERDAARWILAMDVAERVLHDPTLAGGRDVVQLIGGAGSDVVELLAASYVESPALAVPGRGEWSPAVVRHAALFGLDAVRALWPALGDPPEGLPALRERLGTILTTANWLEEVERRAWVTGVQAAREGVVDLDRVTAQLAVDVGDGNGYPSALSSLVDQVIDAVLAPALGDALGALDGDDLARLALLLAASGGPRFMQAIDVVQLTANAWTVVGSGDSGVLSGHDAAAGDVISTPGEKLRGLEFMRFAAFYKRSWRANDWMWGRLDATTHLCAMLLDVERLKSLYGDGWTDVTKVVLEGLTGDDALPDDVSNEITGLAADASQLPLTVRWLAAQHQRAILREELPVVAAGVRFDEKAGSTNRAAKKLADTCPADIVPNGKLAEVVSAYRVHNERMADEVKTQLGIVNATQLAAVGVAATSSERSGLPSPIRAVIATLRGVTLVLMVMAQGVRKRPAVTVATVTAATIGLSLFVIVDRLGPEESLGVNYQIPVSLLVALVVYGALIKLGWVAPAVAVISLGVAAALLWMPGDERYWAVAIGYGVLVVFLLVIFGVSAMNRPAPSPGPSTSGAGGESASVPSRPGFAGRLGRVAAWLLLSLGALVGVVAVLVFVVGPVVEVEGSERRCPLFGSIDEEAVQEACAPYVGHLRFFGAGLVLLAVVIGILWWWARHKIAAVQRQTR